MKLNKKVAFIMILTAVSIILLNTKVKAAETVEIENTNDFITAMSNPEVDSIRINAEIVVSEDINVTIDGNDKVLNLNGNNIIIEENHKFVVNYNKANKFTLENSRGRGLISSIETKETSRPIFKPYNYTNEDVEMIINGVGVEAKALWIFEDTDRFNLTINKGNFRTLCSLFKFSESNSKVNLNKFTLKSLLDDEEENLRIAYWGKYAQDDISTIMGKNSKLTYINLEGESIDITGDAKCGDTYKNNGILYMMPARVLEINNITFETKEYGYKTVKQKQIVLNNISEEAINVVDVMLFNKDNIDFTLGNIDNPDNQEFEIPSILPENSYQSFVIRPIDDLKPGKYYAIIIARTIDGDEYRAKATFEVTKAHLKNLSINLNNWSYEDEPNTPSSSGNLGKAHETYEYAEKVEGVPIENLEFTTQVPNEVGKYIVRLTVDETDLYYEGSAIKEFEITRKDIESQVNIEQANFVYSGDQIKPEITVTFNDNEEIKTLEKDIDYSIEYGENINAGIGTITIKSLDTSNYIFDNKTEEFTIVPKEILSENVKTPEYIKWTGSALQPNVTVTDDEQELIKDTDYEVTYEGQNGDANDKITVTVTGKGNYVGVIEKTVTITKKKNQVLNFSETEITKKYNDSKFTITPNHTEGDGEVSYISSNTDVVEVNSATGEITIVGIGNAEITATADETQNFLSEKASYTITVNKADYDMSKVKFENLVVTYDKNIHSIIATNLPEGVAVKYTNNGKIEPGKYNVIASFTGDTEHYNIIKDKQAILTINKANYNMNYVNFDDLVVTYDGKEHSIIATGLPEGVSVSYSNNGIVNVGTYIIKAYFGGDTACYNLISEQTATLTIKAKNIADVTVSGIKDKTYTGKKLTQAIVIKDGNMTLKEGTDYTIKYKSNKKIGTATITITGKGNYTGEIKRTFKITPKGTKLTKLTAGKKQFKVTWKKQRTETSGYEIQYSTDKNFKSGNKKVKIKKNKTTSNTIKKLKGKKKYYVRIRTYKVVDGKKYYSGWSKVLKVKTKK